MRQMINSKFPGVAYPPGPSNKLAPQGFIIVFFFLFLDERNKNKKKKTLMNPWLAPLALDPILAGPTLNCYRRVCLNHRLYFKSSIPNSIELNRRRFKLFLLNFHRESKHGLHLIFIHY